MKTITIAILLIVCSASFSVVTHAQESSNKQIDSNKTIQVRAVKITGEAMLVYTNTNTANSSTKKEVCGDVSCLTQIIKALPLSQPDT